jgi:hypothetical protein
MLGRRDFLRYISVTAGGLLIPRWLPPKPEQFTDSSAGARVALVGDGKVLAARTVPYISRDVGTHTEWSLAENICWPAGSIELDWMCLEEIWTTVPWGSFRIWDGRVFVHGGKVSIIWDDLTGLHNGTGAEELNAQMPLFDIRKHCEQGGMAGPVAKVLE